MEGAGLFDRVGCLRCQLLKSGGCFPEFSLLVDGIVQVKIPVGIGWLFIQRFAVLGLRLAETQRIEL